MSSRKQRLELGRVVHATSSPAIVEPKRLPSVRVLTRATVMISDAFEVIAHEIGLAKDRTRAYPDTPMDDGQAETFGRHVRALVMLSGEQREARKLDDALSRLTDEQLMVLAKAALKELEGK